MYPVFYSDMLSATSPQLRALVTRDEPLCCAWMNDFVHLHLYPLRCVRFSKAVPITDDDFIAQLRPDQNLSFDHVVLNNTTLRSMTLREYYDLYGPGVLVLTRDYGWKRVRDKTKWAISKKAVRKLQ